MQSQVSNPLCSFDPAQVAYTFVRHIGFILDELSSQGLELWVASSGKWYWSWQGTTLKSERGFWALGEAIVDAVITRYPATFSIDKNNPFSQ